MSWTSRVVASRTKDEKTKDEKTGASLDGERQTGGIGLNKRIDK